jgi:hypothetical protein
MTFGCDNCKTPTLYEGLPQAVKEQLPPRARLHELWSHSPRPRCEHSLPIFPKCPYCQEAIDRKNFGAPIPLLAGSLAGKTVYSAALAIALNRENRLSALGARVAPNSKYAHEILNPLSRGIIPAKTQKDGQRRIRIHLGGTPPWPSRLMTISDAAGEIYEKSDPEAHDLDVKIKSMLIFSNASLYLLNPQVSGYGDGRRLAPVDVYGVLKELVQVLIPSRALENMRASAVNDVLKSVEDELHKRGYPAPLGDGSLNDYGPLANLLLVRIHNHCGALSNVDKLRQDIASMLKRYAAAAENQPSYQDVLQSLHQYIALRADHMIADNKVDHRLALVISKFDLLESALSSSKALGFESLDNLLPQLPPNASPAVWKEMLIVYSKRCERILRDLGEDNFMNWARAAFREVGVFFVSSLGRRVECFVEEADTTEDLGSTDQEWTAIGPSANHVPKLVTSRWNLKKRIIEGPDGTRQPTPKGVELPLMWLMLGEG